MCALFPLSRGTGRRFQLAPRGSTELHQTGQTDDQHTQEEEQIGPGAWSPRKLSPRYHRRTSSAILGANPGLKQSYLKLQ